MPKTILGIRVAAAHPSSFLVSKSLPRSSRRGAPSWPKNDLHNITPYGVMSRSGLPWSVSNEKELSVMSTMQQRVVSMLALSAASVFAVTGEQAESSAQPTKPARKKTGYAPVNGLKMYYEVTGEGKP